MPEFKVLSDFQPTGDQPEVIDALAEELKAGTHRQIRLGVTSSRP